MMGRLKRAVLRRMAVRGNVSTGDNFHVGPGSTIWAPNTLFIGNDVYVGKFVTIEVDGSIGDGTMIANNVGVVGRHDHDIADIGNAVRHSRWVGDGHSDLALTTQVGADVWIGYGAIIMSGVSIGDHAVVAAGSVVTHDVPSNAIVAGVPATPKRTRFSAGELLQHRNQLEIRGIRMSSQQSFGN